MVKTARWVLAAAAALALSGCGYLPPLQTDAAYPVYGNPVNPTPAPGYRVECSSIELPPNTFRDPFFRSGCRQIIAPATVVVRAAG